MRPTLWLCLWAASLGGRHEPTVRQEQERDWHAEELRLSALADDTERARGLAELYGSAGLPAAAWRTAQAGLVQAPEDLTLLFHAAANAMRLSQADLAREALDRLRGSLVRAALTAEVRGRWEESRESLEHYADELDLRRASRVRAVAWARRLSLVLIGASIVAGMLLLAGVKADPRGLPGNPRPPGSSIPSR